MGIKKPVSVRPGSDDRSEDCFYVYDADGNTVAMVTNWCGPAATNREAYADEIAAALNKGVELENRLAVLERRWAKFDETMIAKVEEHI